MKSSNLHYLQTLAALLPSPYDEICRVVLFDQRFERGAGGSEHHHAYAGGLVDHTAEVVGSCERCNKNINWNILLTAAIWHDYHKIHDYAVFPDGKIEKLPYRNLIGHVVGGCTEFTAVAFEHRLDEEAIQKIAHCLLSHHGRREWGSPVEPQTLEAFILHAADMLSAKGNVTPL